jgi:heme/copper-type cytochrome/quinol oxidase subunit 2
MVVLTVRATLVALVVLWSALLVARVDDSISRSIDKSQDPAVTVIRVSAERFAFTPSEIVIDRGAAVEFHLTSDDTDHGFRIIGTAVDVQIPKRRRGETVVKYTADTAGRFVIECSRPCGAGHTAMRATLVVK